MATNSAHAALLAQLDNPAAKVKVQAKFGGYIRDKLREESSADKLVPFQDIDPSECQMSPEHDSLVRLEFVEPNSRATLMTFRGSPAASFMRGPKVLIPFTTIMTDMFQKPEEEFLAYGYPLAKVVEDNAVRDMAAVQDREYTIHCEAAVQALQAEANGGIVTSLNASSIGSTVEFSVAKGDMARTATADDDTVYPVIRPDFPRLFNLLDGRYLETDQLLMTRVDHNNTLGWTAEDQGDKIQSETLIDGHRYNTFLGKKVVVTIKSDILRPGNIYGFTKPEFLGRNYVLRNVKFWIDKVVNWIKFVAWKTIGMGIVNISAISKLELYSGDATSNDADSILSSVSPKDEEDMFGVNNRAAQGLFFPQVTHF